MYKIVTTPEPILSKISKPIEKFDKKLAHILVEMEKTLRNTSDPVGVGLAAPQVGISYRIFQLKPDENSEVKSFINPKILEISEEIHDDIHQSKQTKKGIKSERTSKPDGKRLLEGCLSIPNIWGYVQRKREVKLSYQDEQGSKKTEIFTGFPAVIVQHEMDHLNGILFTKHVMDQNEKLFKSHKDENGEDVFEEIGV